ncbi:protein of unknown function [Paraburkholderia kururiensis]
MKDCRSGASRQQSSATCARSVEVEHELLSEMRVIPRSTGPERVDVRAVTHFWHAPGKIVYSPSAAAQPYTAVPGCASGKTESIPTCYLTILTGCYLVQRFEVMTCLRRHQEGPAAAASELVAGASAVVSLAEY